MALSHRMTDYLQMDGPYECKQTKRLNWQKILECLQLLSCFGKVRIRN